MPNAGAATEALTAPDPVAAAAAAAAEPEPQYPAPEPEWPLDHIVVELLNRAHRAHENSQWVFQGMERAADDSGAIPLHDAIRIAQDYIVQYWDHLRAERFQDPPSSAVSSGTEDISLPI